MARSSVVLPEPDRPMMATIPPPANVQADASQHLTGAATDTDVAQGQDRAHDVGAFHRRSRRRASEASGIDISR